MTILFLSGLEGCGIKLSIHLCVTFVFTFAETTFTRAKHLPKSMNFTGKVRPEVGHVLTGVVLPGACPLKLYCCTPSNCTISWCHGPPYSLNHGTLGKRLALMQDRTSVLRQAGTVNTSSLSLIYPRPTHSPSTVSIM